MEQTNPTSKPRTPKQNRALYKYFEWLANAFNEAGLDMKTVLKPTVDIPWTKDSVKEFIWKPIQEAALGSDSTRKLSTKDLDYVFHIINRHISEKFGIHVPFPSIQSLLELSTD